MLLLKSQLLPNSLQKKIPLFSYFNWRFSKEVHIEIFEGPEIFGGPYTSSEVAQNLQFSFFRLFGTNNTNYNI